MELNPFAARRADPFHDKLRLTDYFIAGVTRLTRTCSAPNTRNTILRKPTIIELALDQETKGVRVHAVPLSGLQRQMVPRQIHRGLGATPPTQ